MASQDALLSALFVVRLLFPTVLLAIALSFFSLTPHATTSPSPITTVVVAVKTPRRSLILSILSLVAFTYFFDGFALVLHSILTKTWQGTPRHNWWRSQWSGLDIEAVLGLLASSLLAILGIWKESQGVTVWILRRPRVWALTAVLGTILEVAFLLSTLSFTQKQPVGIPERPPIAQPKIPSLLHALFPLFRLLFLLPLYPILAYPRINYVPVAGENPAAAASEDTGLLYQAEHNGELASQGLSATNANNQYGTFRQGRSGAPTPGEITRSHTPAPSEGQDVIRSLKTPKPNGKASGSSEQAAVENITWSVTFSRLKRIAPFLWPKKSRWLQFLAFLCMLVLLVGRLVNVALPLTLGALIDNLEYFYNGTPQPRSFWPYLLSYAGLRFLQGSGGLNALRDTLWAPVMQYSDREMSIMTFNHLLSLSLAFHTRRKTGEVLRILDRGSAINRVFELILFSICPTFLDIFVAIGIFVWRFGWELALVVAFVLFGYISASITLTSWRTRIRRQMNDKDIIARGIHTDCLLNYETVKYFGGEPYESERYLNAIGDYQGLEYRVIVSLNLLNFVQNLMISLGLLIGGIIVALRVTRHECTPGEFVVFITYLIQLYGPLNQLGYIYRSLNTSLVDTEKLMKLLEEPTEVNDKPGAPDLMVHDGEIEFDNVSFSYDGRTTALNRVSFKVPKGSRVALVGESGSGKSTILRLLYRFYDLKNGEGRILIDGRDIRDVTQSSLRQAIGVVPQDPVLFNASIGYNIGYGKFGASQDEIEVAAKAAQMHERILSFPDGYETKVGERGVRLSGGEKQRVAIARTLLKNPPILLLDEATSALDTSTEKDIQKALQNLVQGRSSLSIAHRLSTIASADVILVLKDGQIVEQGSHRELLDKNGIFAKMWASQVTSEEVPLASLTDRKVKEEEASKVVVVEEEGEEAQKEADKKVPADEIAKPPEEEREVVAKIADARVEPQIDDGERISEGPGLAIETEAVDEATTLKPRDGGESAPTPLLDEDKKETSEQAPSFAEVAAREPDADAPVVAAAPGPSIPPAALGLGADPSKVGGVGVVAFPTHRDSTESFPSAPFPAPAPASTVTFDEGTQFPERGVGAGAGRDRERKRTLSVGPAIQRLTRRISLTPRRAGSQSNIPNLKELLGGGGSKDKDKETKGEGSGTASSSVRDGDSPSGSIREDDKGKKPKKKRQSTGKLPFP